MGYGQGAAFGLALWAGCAVGSCIGPCCTLPQPLPSTAGLFLCAPATCLLRRPCLPAEQRGGGGGGRGGGGGAAPLCAPRAPDGAAVLAAQGHPAGSGAQEHGGAAPRVPAGSGRQR